MELPAPTGAQGNWERILEKIVFERIRVSRAYINPQKSRAQGETPVFAGFYACFLEIAENGLADAIYCL
jgi:hypothetical protein